MVNQKRLSLPLKNSNNALGLPVIQINAKHVMNGKIGAAVLGLNGQIVVGNNEPVATGHVQTTMSMCVGSLLGSLQKMGLKQL